MGKFFLLILFSLFFTGQSPAQKTAILCKSLIDGTGKVIADAAILVDGNRIVSIEKKSNLPKGITIIDLGDFTVLPGMIDMHVHPDMATDDYQVGHLRGSSASKALIGLKHVQELLNAGWTAVRVAGDADVGYANMEIRNAVNKGMFVGPHITEQHIIFL